MKKVYQKPSLEVVELRQQTSLLQNSVFDNEVNAAMNTTWEEENI